MPPLYKRKGSPKWWVRISIAGVKTRRTTGTEDREQAEEFEQRERDRLWRLHKLGDRGALRWKDATTRYLGESKRPRERDREIIGRLADVLDNEPVRGIDTSAIEELRKDLLEDGLAHSTVDRFMRTVRAVLRRCVAWNVLESAPHVPMYNTAAPEPRWLKHPQFEALEAELPEHLGLAASFAVRTGLRHDSMVELTWERIDLKARRAWIPGDQMKAGRSHGLPLSREAIRVLKRLREINPDGDFVFQWRGERLRQCNTRAFREAVERAGVGPLRWHDLRHTFAAWAVQSGVTLQELMALGGWASYAMVLRYAHLAPDQLASAAEKVGTFKGTVKKRRAQKK